MRSVSDPLRVLSTTAQTPVGEWQPGREITLKLAEEHGLDAAHGVVVDDHLDAGMRTLVDADASRALARWRERNDPALTADGLCLPDVLHLALLAYVAVPTLAVATGLRRALENYGSDRVEIERLGAQETRLVRAVATDAGIPLVAREAPPPPRGKAVRHSQRGWSPLDGILRIGAPSLPRRGAVLILGYWHLAPLIDRLLAGEGPPPAIFITARPPGPARALRSAWAGGVVGAPAPWTVAHARRSLLGALRGIRAPSGVGGIGPALAEELHRRFVAFVGARGPRHLAMGRVLLSVLRSRRIGQVVVPNDTMPEPRLAVLLARSAGVPTLVVQHGLYLAGEDAYPLKEGVIDLGLADEVAVWSSPMIPPIGRVGRAIHVMGYPTAHRIEPARPRPSGALRVLVLIQGREPSTARVPERITSIQCLAALQGVQEVWPDARITLRPRPSADLGGVQVARARFPLLAVAIDQSTPIVDLARRHDVCIGVMSTATCEAALVGIPVVVLNVTGLEWGWPLGGETTVPIARTAPELAAILANLLGTNGGGPPGRQALLEALGATGEDGSERLVELIRGVGQPATAAG